GWAPDILICPLKEDGYPARSVSGIWNAPLDTGETNPAKRTYVYWANGLNGLGRVTFRLFGLIQNETRESWAPGYLEAEAELKPCLTKVAKPQGGAEAEKIYADIVLSPFGLRARMITNISGLTEEDVAEPEKPTYNDRWTGSLELVFRDGEVQSLEPATNSYLRAGFGAQGESLLGAYFQDPVDIRDVRALRIDGVEYPLEKGTPRERQGIWDLEASPLEQTRAWLYGDHAPVHPELTAEGEAFSLSLDGVWTDGYTTELLMKVQRVSSEPIPYDWDICAPVNLGGKASFEALDARGERVAVGVRYAGAAEGLVAYALDCPEKARTLVVRFEDTVLTVPLDMRELGKLRQIVPQEPSRGYIPDPESEARIRQRMFDSLFAGYTPVEVNRTADNGIYRITVESLAHRGGGGSGNLRAWVVCSALEGDYDPLLDMNGMPFACYVLSGGQELQVNGGAGGGSSYDRETGVQIYRLSVEYSGDFGHVDALRLVWTPPAGDRITLDLERTF
ncbi:MAG: hypothetical protein IKX47_04875, partial [Oscillospiraceae bacterium]|nr:hypothetical protein [Oscillospiraceae bacterium]